MAGLSMGTFETRQVALANLDKFSYFGIFSGGTIAPADITDKTKKRILFMSFGSREKAPMVSRAPRMYSSKPVSTVSPMFLPLPLTILETKSNSLHSCLKLIDETEHCQST